MLSLIQSEIKRPLNFKKLRTLLPNYVKVARYDELKGKKTLTEVLGGKSVLIVLWNIHNAKHRVLNQPGHFFAISTRGPEPCVVFSSTGMTPREELFITQSDPTLLKRILPKGTVYNNLKLQTSNDSQTCWRWCILFSHMSSLGLKKFQSLFRKPSITIHDPDVIATLMTLILLFD